MCWEVGVGLETLWGPGDGSQPPSPPVREAAWDQALHRLTAASVVRDNEQLALRGGAETTADRGEWLMGPVRAQRHGLKAAKVEVCVFGHSPYLTFITKDLRLMTDKIKN